MGSGASWDSTNSCAVMSSATDESMGMPCGLKWVDSAPAAAVRAKEVTRKQQQQ
jgi:hypothetical protein